MISYPIQITALHSLDFDGEYEVPEHRQTKHQFYCVLEGDVSYRIEGNHFELSRGDALVIAPGLKRLPKALSDQGKTLVVGFVSPWSDLGRPKGMHLKLNEVLLEEAEKLADGNFYPQEHLVAILFHHLLLGLIGEGWFRRLGQGTDSRAAQIKAEGEFLVQQVEEIMQANIEQPLQLSDFVELSGVSSAHLRRLFQRHRKVPPCTHFRNMRLEKAHRLLQNSQASVVEVAFDLGFSSSQHLAMAFRKHFGYTPSEAILHQKYDSVEYV